MASATKKPRAPPKSWSDIELRYIWDVVGQQRKDGMSWTDCAINMHIAMQAQNHVRRRYDAHSITQCWRNYFSDRARDRGTFDFINSAPLNRRPPPRPAANNPRPVVKTHYRPQQMLLATNARAPVDWGYGTAEFENAIARPPARGVGENEGSAASAVHNDEEDYDEMLHDEENEDNEDDLPDVNDLAKERSRRAEVFETPDPRPVSSTSTRVTRPSNRAQKHVISEDDDSGAELDDSDYEEPVDSPGLKRLKKVVTTSTVRHRRQVEYEVESDVSSPIEEQTNSAAGPEGTMNEPLLSPGKAGDMRYPPISNPRPHNVYYTPLGTPHHPEAPHSAPIIRSAHTGPFFVPMAPRPRQKPGPKPRCPNPEIFKSNPSREALDRHMTHGTGVIWADAGRILTAKEKAEKKREEMMAERERKIAAGIKVRKPRGPAKNEVPPPLIAPNIHGNQFTRLQMMQDAANLEKAKKKF